MVYKRSVAFSAGCRSGV